MNPIITIFVVSLIAIFILVLTLWRARRILESWAEDNNYRLLSSEIRWLRKGPFLSWSTSKNQVVYHVTVQTLDSQIKRGWVKCGSFWLGIFKNKVEVRWED